MEIIKANKLTIGYRQGKRGNKIVHQDLSFALEEGKLTCLLGPNGAGKSTLLRTISGSQEALGGELSLYDHPIDAYGEKELAKMFGLVLTDKTMGGGLKVWDMVSMGRYPYTGFFGRLEEGDRRIVEHAIESVGISHKKDSYVSELSDGVRQKVMIAKALAQECPVMILDEPTAFLDITSRIEIMNLLHELTVTQHKTILMSTHDMEQALLLGDRLWLLSENYPLECGVTEDLIFSGAIDRFFSGSKIRFDKINGGFRPVYAGLKKIYVEASDELMYWANNILTRNGYTITNNPEESTVSICMESPNQIIYKDLSETYVLNSFEELSKILGKDTF